MSATAGGAGGQPAEPGAGAPARVTRLVVEYLPAMLVAVAGLAIWEIALRTLNMRAFILPTPSAILAALAANWGGGRFPLLGSAQATLIEAVGGFLIGVT